MTNQKNWQNHFPAKKIESKNDRDRINSLKGQVRKLKKELKQLKQENKELKRVFKKNIEFIKDILGDKSVEDIFDDLME